MLFLANGADLYEDEPMRLLVVLAGFAAAIGLAMPAQADPSGNDPGPDANFLSELNNAGITYQNGPDAIAIGRRACQLMDQGHTEADVIKSMTEQNAGFTIGGATKFTKIAESAYCPQYLTGGPSPAPPPPSEPAVPPFFPLPGLPAAR
jgi:Protein of unknown function (DUF732)